MPRVVRSHKEALTKTDIQTILNACSNIKLKTYILLLAATGCRASEALSIRLRDIDFESNPPIIFLRGMHTKTKTDRTIMLTNELAQQLKSWLDYKYRTRMIGHYNKEMRKTHHEKHTPNIDKDMLIFSERRKHTQKEESATIEGLYTTMMTKFDELLDRLGGRYAEVENSQNRRRKITFHSIRRMVKSVISDLGLEQYSEIYIGHHSKSTYYRISQADRIKLFRKIEPSLTYLDISSLERHGNDMQTRLEVMERENMEIKGKYEQDIKSMQDKMNHIMEMIQDNPKLAHVKPEVLVKKTKN
jgi:integrase